MQQSLEIKVYLYLHATLDNAVEDVSRLDELYP